MRKIYIVEKWLNYQLFYQYLLISQCLLGVCLKNGDAEFIKGHRMTLASHMKLTYAAPVQLC